MPALTATTPPGADRDGDGRCDVGRVDRRGDRRADELMGVRRRQGDDVGPAVLGSERDPGAGRGARQGQARIGAGHGPGELETGGSTAGSGSVAEAKRFTTVPALTATTPPAPPDGDGRCDVGRVDRRGDRRADELMGVRRRQGDDVGPAVLGSERDPGAGRGARQGQARIGAGHGPGELETGGCDGRVRIGRRGREVHDRAGIDRDDAPRRPEMETVGATLAALIGADVA